MAWTLSSTYIVYNGLQRNARASVHLYKTKESMRQYLMRREAVENNLQTSRARINARENITLWSAENERKCARTEKKTPHPVTRTSKFAQCAPALHVCNTATNASATQPARSQKRRPARAGLTKHPILRGLGACKRPKITGGKKKSIIKHLKCYYYDESHYKARIYINCKLKIQMHLNLSMRRKSVFNAII